MLPRRSIAERISKISVCGIPSIARASCKYSRWGVCLIVSNTVLLSENIFPVVKTKMLVHLKWK